MKIKTHTRARAILSRTRTSYISIIRFRTRISHKSLISIIIVWTQVFCLTGGRENQKTRMQNLTFFFFFSGLVRFSSQQTKNKNMRTANVVVVVILLLSYLRVSTETKRFRLNILKQLFRKEYKKYLKFSAYYKQ